MKFYHYGGEKSSIGFSDVDSFVVINGKYGNSGLDMRATVGHLTRNIRIGSEGSYAGHL